VTAELQVLLSSIAGGTGALLSFWAGWRARDRQRPTRGSYGAPRITTCGGGEITRAEWGAMSTRFTESSVQRGNRSGEPTAPKPEIVPKPVPTSGRNPFVSEFQQQINNALNLDGYQPRPSRPGANPPPSEP